MQLHTPGGIERFISTLATMLSNDFEVEIIANYGRTKDTLAFPLPSNLKLTFLTPDQPEEISMKYLITHFKLHRIPSEIIRRLTITKNQKQAFKAYLSRLDTDYIITDRANYNNLISRYYHGHAIKIATDHNFHQNNPKYINELIKSLKGFNYLIVATEELKNFYKNKIKPTKCLAIPNPLISIPTQKSMLKSKNLLSIGRLCPEKDFSTLIAAMQIVHRQDPDIHLAIIGDGNERQALQNQISSLHLTNSITLTGWLPQNKIAKYYYDSSLFVMTSKTEAFGLVLTEAMSYGLPCLALSRASGARAQITKDTGLLINTENPTIIASHVLNLIHHPAVLKSYQLNISKTIRNYSLDSVKQSWLQILQ